MKKLVTGAVVFMMFSGLCSQKVKEIVRPKTAMEHSEHYTVGRFALLYGR